MSQLGYEKSDVSVKKIVLFSLAPVMFLVLSIVGVHYYLKLAQFQATLVKDRAVDTQITTIRETAQRRLTGYAKNNDGTYSIPIDRAMDIYIQE